MIRSKISRLAMVATLLSGSAVADEPAAAPAAADLLAPPILIESDGKPIDTGAAWGHSSPSIVDLNRDGLFDLVVGDFGGKFRFYKNVGSASQPAFKDEGLLQAGGSDAEVRIYCCIGSQPRFHDFDGDGTLDMLANSYDPGHAYLFRGRPDGTFAAREELVDKSGVPIRSSPVQEQDFQSFGSFYEAVDWDNDKDLDLLIGCFDGELKLRINEGTAQTPEFATDNTSIEVAGEPLKVKAHFCPVVADWDADGLWDILAGSDDGSVTFFRNVGTLGQPQFAAGSILLKPHDGNGYDILRLGDEPIVPGIRSQAEVVDFNRDGKLDLIVGDFYTAYDLKPGLTESDQQEVKTLIAESTSGSAAFAKKMEDLRKDFAERYPGDEIYSDQATKEWSEAYSALRDSPEAKQMEEQEKTFVQKMRTYLATTRGDQERSFDLSHAHGHVWLFIRQ